MVVAYEGTALAGWQTQPGQRTVQALLEEALAALCGAAVRVEGSGRTDRGVHARGQVAHVDLPAAAAARRLRRGLNALLPPDVRVLSVRVAPPDFHARFSARGKEYRYAIWNGPVLPPHLRHTHLHVPRPLDVPAMQAAALALEGRHDFSAFAANPNRVVEDPVRQLERLSIHKHGHALEIRAVGGGFLYKMVRSLTGFLLRVGRGEQSVADAREILAGRLRTARVPTAPPQGLILWRVFY
ncbi:MAG: tRNA pseudouridine(38-40) synthase TruA [Candidatus Marinimicrobia bacterium]|nr:tRNA pseudouridine(38-40) synthase TruA [Candidatus Neomarinimicrobiota bacterium]